MICENEARLEAERILMKPVVFFGPLCTKNIYRGKSLKPLPSNVKLLTLDRLSEHKAVLVRLENMGMETAETVSLREVVEKLGDLVEVTEMTLDGNMRKLELERLNWNVREGPMSVRKTMTETFIDTDKVEIKPKEIRTFLLSIK